MRARDTKSISEQHQRIRVTIDRGGARPCSCKHSADGNGFSHQDVSHEYKCPKEQKGIKVLLPENPTARSLAPAANLVMLG